MRLVNESYLDLQIPENSLIYCDPPYEGTTKYKSNETDFNHAEFWQWCRTKTKEGHQVYISEYNAPSDFKCVWSKEINCNLPKTSKRKTERLFVYSFEN